LMGDVPRDLTTWLLGGLAAVERSYRAVDLRVREKERKRKR